jgi:hypothetical protein
MAAEQAGPSDERIAGHEAGHILNVLVRSAAEAAGGVPRE